MTEKRRKELVQYTRVGFQSDARRYRKKETASVGSTDGLPCKRPNSDLDFETIPLVYQEVNSCSATAVHSCAFENFFRTIE